MLFNSSIRNEKTCQRKNFFLVCAGVDLSFQANFLTQKHLAVVKDYNNKSSIKRKMIKKITRGNDNKNSQAIKLAFICIVPQTRPSHIANTSNKNAKLFFSFFSVNPMLPLSGGVYCIVIIESPHDNIQAHTATPIVAGMMMLFSCIRQQRGTLETMQCKLHALQHCKSF